MRSFDFKLELVYFQFYLADMGIDLRGVDPNIWDDPEARSRELAILPNIVIVRADEPSHAEVNLILLDSCPSNDVVTDWGKVLEFSLTVINGGIVVDDFPFNLNGSAPIEVSSGDYTGCLLRDHLKDPLKKDLYCLYLWPTESDAKMHGPHE
jgi:hypothetical protein